MSIISQYFSVNNKNVNIKALSRDEFKDAIAQQKIQLIDVRTPIEYGAGHITGAVNLNFFDQPTFQKGIEKLDKSAAIYLYCQSGNRSKTASKFFAQKGFDQIFDLKGGYSNW